MKLSQIRKNPNNPRTIRDEKFEKLKRSIQDFPQMMELRPIIVDEAGIILGGNMRYEAIKSLKMAEFPDAWVKRVEELTEDQKKEFIVKDNVGFGDWDWDAIANEWDELPLDDWGLDVPAFEAVKPEETQDAEPQIDKAAELNEKWQVKTGDLWQIGDHRLLCGDSTNLDLMRGFINGDTQTVFFDPPYDAELEVVTTRWGCKDALVFTDHRHLLDCIDGWGRFRSVFCWDGVTSWFVPGQPLARGKFCLWFGESSYNAEGSHYGEPDKAHTVSNSRGSYEYIPNPRGKHLSTVFQSPNTQQFEGHKHSKPIEWLKMLIANCTTGTVFDPFAGSGSAMVACENLKRVCLSVELEANNVAVILERMSQLGLTPRLIEG